MYLYMENSNCQQQHIKQLQALFSITQTLSVRYGQGKMLQEALETIESLLGVHRCTIMLLSPDGRELHFEAASNISSLSSNETSFQMGEGITGRVLQTGEPAVISRISDEPKFSHRIHKRDKTEHHEMGFICVPISFGNEVVGTLAADIPQSADMTIDDALRMLSIIAGMIAHDVKLRREARLERNALEHENRQLRHELEEHVRPSNMTGNSRAMREVYQRIEQVAATDTTVLIRGESGTGKELVATAIHYASYRRKKPFVKVNCAALSETLLESELFGHEKGAFTGAVHPRKGRIEMAQEGTLFLDEIGDFSPAIQVKLLRVLQEREYERVGSNETARADIRIIAATHRDLEKQVESEKFRQDLYYRINVFPIYLPPLRERKDDIMILGDHFVEKYSKKMSKTVNRISTTAINMMYSYHWPGNVRELENCIEYAVLMSNDNVIHGYNLPPTLQTPDKTESSLVGKLKTSVNLLERDMIIDSLKRNKGSVTSAANELGITDRMIRYKMKNLGIDYKNTFKKNYKK